MANRVTWNTWHGCRKCSEGCKNCYVYEGDAKYGLDPEEIRLVKSKFKLPLMKSRNGDFKIPLNSNVGVCLTSDFFLEEADQWRDEAWQMMKLRPDCHFYIITKRVHRIMQCLPADWGDGYPNVMLSLTVENQKRANEKIPQFLDIPCALKTLTIAPILESIDLREYLSTGKIVGISIGGENTEDRVSARQCDYDWFLDLYEQCKTYKIDYNVFSLGSNFIKNGRLYKLTREQTYSQSVKMGLSLNYHGIYI